MSSPRAVLVALVALTLAACSTGPSPRPTAVARATLLPASATSAAPTVAIPTAAATREPTAKPTPRPTARSTPTPLAPPPPPTGVRITRQGAYVVPKEEGDPTGEFKTTVTWKEPRSKGIEIRVFGVTGCLSADEVSGHGRCLVKRTALPTSMRALIAKAPASKGTVSWTWPAWGELVEADTGGPSFVVRPVATHDDVTYYAIVVAAYDATGHSRFIIAEAGTWCYEAGCD